MAIVPCNENVWSQSIYLYIQDILDVNRPANLEKEEKYLSWDFSVLPL